jgi:hypothetical protein
MMAKIDELLSKVIRFQTTVTKAIAMQLPADVINERAKNRDNAANALTAYVTELEKKLADLTPHPDDASYEADYDDHSRGW